MLSDILVINALGIGLTSVPYQIIIVNNVGLLLAEPLGTHSMRFNSKYKKFHLENVMYKTATILFGA